VVEPLVSKQWYVNVKPLAEVALAAAHDGRITIIPTSWTKTYDQWMENIRPWCISRQLWWGHRIPAWYCEADGSVHVSRTDLSACPTCGGVLRQDPDVLDTWFSSGIWPFSTLGWPDDTPELRRYYPTSVLVTGFDILFFWVARMAMLGLHFMKEEPFRDVYIHALVRDAEGQKMSKSKGNVIDPLAIMDRFGTDAFRFTLAALAAQGRDIRISDDRVEGYRNFANKLWNAARLVLGNLDGYDPAGDTSPAGLPGRWIQSRLQSTITSAREALQAYRFNDAAGAIYHFLWNDFCDWYLEAAKGSLYHASSRAERNRVQHTLVTVLETTLRLLHPFMPFITEELWQRLPHDGHSVMVAPYPRAVAERVAPEAEREMAVLVQAITAVRTIRGEMRIAPGVPLEVLIRPVPEHAAVLEEHRSLLEALGRCRVRLDPRATRPRESALAVLGRSEIYVALAGVVDLSAERARLDKEVRRAAEQIAFLESKLGRPDFVERAPAAVVAKERERLDEQRRLKAKLEASRASIAEGLR
jgi:valyl-tRNA synthetase